MLTGRNKDTAAAYEPNAFVESAGCGRSELKNPATDIDSVGSAIEDFDKTVLIGCARSAAASVYLADHDLISSTRRRSRRRSRARSWSWTRRWRRRRTWRWSSPDESFPHPAPVCTHTKKL